MTKPVWPEYKAFPAETIISWAQDAWKNDPEGERPETLEDSVDFLLAKHGIKNCVDLNMVF